MKGTSTFKSLSWPVLGLAVGTFLAASACALNLPPVRVDGSPAALARLVGEWVGEYTSDEMDGRSGSIVFILDAGQNFARGDVLMTPKGSRGPYQRRDPDDPVTGRTLAVAAESLTILFVRAEDGTLYGELDPYWDPDRHCEARTMFQGVLAGNAIRGTYQTTFASPHSKVTGRWRVTRLTDSKTR